MSADAKFGGPLHIEALPDQQQVKVSPELLLYLAHHGCQMSLPHIPYAAMMLCIYLLITNLTKNEQAHCPYTARFHWLPLVV